jgi:hypothetical protein
MQYVQNQTSFIVSSDTANGALNVRDTGSTFDVQLDNPISIPASAKFCTLEVNQAQIWWTVPNISANLGNNKFYFSTVEPAVWQNFTIPDGLYSVSSLNSLISRELVNLGEDGDAIVLSGDESTQKSIFTFKAIDTSIDFTQADTPRLILGFNSAIVGPSVSAGQSISGDTVAAFNVVNSFLLHSNIVNNGIPTNDTGANTIASVPIDVAPGSQITFQPRNPVATDASNLTGKMMNRFTVWLTSQSNIKVDTFNETYQAQIVIRWYEPI